MQVTSMNDVVKLQRHAVRISLWEYCKLRLQRLRQKIRLQRFINSLWLQSAEWQLSNYPENLQP